MIDISLAALGMVLSLVAGLFIGVGLTLGAERESSSAPASRDTE